VRASTVLRLWLAAMVLPGCDAPVSEAEPASSPPAPSYTPAPSPLGPAAASTPQPEAPPREKWFLWYRDAIETRQGVDSARIELQRSSPTQKFRLGCHILPMEDFSELHGVLDTETDTFVFRSEQCTLRFHRRRGPDGSETSMTIREVGPCQLPDKRCTFNGVYEPEPVATERWCGTEPLGANDRARSTRSPRKPGARHAR